MKQSKITIIVETDGKKHTIDVPMAEDLRIEWHEEETEGIISKCKFVFKPIYNDEGVAYTVSNDFG